MHCLKNGFDLGKILDAVFSLEIKSEDEFDNFIMGRILWMASCASESMVLKN
jgi:hypothetical protein